MDLSALSCPLPQDISLCLAAGQWQEAEAMIAERLDGGLPAMMRERLQWAQLFLERLRRCYTLSREALRQELGGLIPGFGEDDLTRLQRQGWLDFRFIEGRQLFFEDTVASLLKANPEIARRAGRPLSPSRPVLDDAMARMRRDGGLAMRLRLTTSLQIGDSAFAAGERCFVHLPLPGAAPQQHEVAIEGISPAPARIADETAPQRSAWFDLAMQENAPFTASSAFTQRLRYCDPMAMSPKIPYPAAPPPQPEDLAEQGPHLLFTPYLRALCAELTRGETRPLHQVRRFYDYITTHVLYSYVRPYLLIENGAEYAAVNRRGDCGLQALLFIALCRIAGIPARWQSGLYAAPGDAGSHDWAWFFTDAWGWLPADCSFGGAARRGGNEERRQFYFGNLDPYRAVFNHRYMAPLTPSRRFPRLDPYDNQQGEVETASRSLLPGEYHTTHEVDIIGA